MVASNYLHQRLYKSLPAELLALVSKYSETDAALDEQDEGPKVDSDIPLQEPGAHHMDWWEYKGYRAAKKCTFQEIEGLKNSSLRLVDGCGCVFACAVGREFDCQKSLRKIGRKDSFTRLAGTRPSLPVEV